MNIKALIQKHFWYYLSLVFLQLIGLGLLFFTGSNIGIQITAIIVMSVFYMFWASFHHYFHHNLTPKIVVEYVLMGLLGIVVSIFLIQPL